MREIQRVAGAGVIYGAALVPYLQPIVAGVVEAAERQRRTGFVAFRSVVVDDVENYLDAGGMQPAHRDAHLVRRAVRQIGRFRREEAERVVAPVVAQATLLQGAVLQEGLHRHQFDRGDARGGAGDRSWPGAASPANVPRSVGRISPRSMVSPRTCAS